MLAAKPEYYLITPAVAAMAAERGTAVVTTVSGGGDPTAAIIANFKMLDEAGVTLLIGSEATFVVLPSELVENFDAIRHVEWVVKRGNVLRSPN